jgi:hypothetical protein
VLPATWQIGKRSGRGASAARPLCGRGGGGAESAVVSPSWREEDANYLVLFGKLFSGFMLFITMHDWLCCFLSFNELLQCIISIPLLGLVLIYRVISEVYVYLPTPIIKKNMSRFLDRTSQI